MKGLNALENLINSLLNIRKSKKREMKRVFQWRRYIEWKDLTSKEKVSAKRFLLLPIFAYLMIGLFHQNFFLIVLFLIGYVLYKKFEKGGIVKK